MLSLSDGGELLMSFLQVPADAGGAEFAFVSALSTGW